MKAYIGTVSWADECDVFFYSIETNERIEAMKELLEIYSELGLFEYKKEVNWGTNQWFEFDKEDFLEFLDNAKDISEEELAVLDKFKVVGFDIYDKIDYLLEHALLRYDYCTKKYITNKYVTQEYLNKVKPVFLKLFPQESWHIIQESYNNSCKKK